MPAAAPVAGAAIVAGAAAAGATAAQLAALSLAIAVASAFSSTMMARAAAKRAAARRGDIDQGRQLANNRSSRQPLPVLYGRCLVGVNKTFAHTENPYLYLVCELGEGEIHGIYREDGTVYTTTGESLPRDNPPRVYLDDTLWTEFKGELRIRIEFFNGGAEQMPCATLAALPSILPQWNEALRHTAYLMVRIKYDAKQFASEPDITVDLAGLKVLDPASGQTGFSDNPALAAYDYLRRGSEVGGFGIAPARIDADSVAEAAAYCQAKGWTCNLPLVSNQAVADNLELILACFRGEVVLSDRFRVLFRDLNYEAVVMALDENDVIDGTLEVVQPDITTRPNQIRATYIDRDKNRRTTDYTQADAAAIARDGDLREATLDLFGMDDLAKVQQMVAYHLERQRLSRPVTLVARERAARLEGTDLITLTHRQFGWTNRMLRVTAAGIRPDHTVALSCEIEDAVFYDDVYNLTERNWDDSNLPDPNTAPPGVYGAALSEEVYYYRGRSFTRLVVAFSGPPDTVYPFWAYAEVWLKIGDAGAWKYMTRSEGDYQVDPVEEGERYYVRLRSVSVFGAREELDSATTLSRMIVGKAAGPSSLSGLTAIPAGDTVILAANPVGDPDVVGYEVRIGNSWSSGIFFAFNLDSRMTISNVRPGTHTFWMAARDNAGRYSTTPVSAAVTVFMPSGYALAHSWSWDYDGIGSHSNTEHTLYNSQDALRCAHAGGVLSGTWTSPEYDMGSVKKVRVFGDFISAFDSPQGRFSSIWGTAKSFADVDPGANKTFAQLYNITTAPVLKARLKWGSVSGSLGDSLDWFEITAPEIEGRYVQVVVSIEDPSLDAWLYLLTLNMQAHTWS